MAAPVSVTAADISPELLALLRAALPEQVGDDLVLRLADGRVFYIDGFFAPDETGNGIAPLTGAIALAADVAALLLGDPEISTAAGAQGDDQEQDSGGGNFATLAPADGTGAPGGAPAIGPLPTATRDGEDELEGAGRRARRDSVDQSNDDNAGQGGTGPRVPDFHGFGSGLLGNSSFPGAGSVPPIGTISLSAGSVSAPASILTLTLSDIARFEEAYARSLATPIFTPPTVLSLQNAFSGLVHYTPLVQSLSVEFIKEQYYAGHGDFMHHLIDNAPVATLYDDFRQTLATLANGRNIWLALDENVDAGPVNNATVANASALGNGATAESVFAGNDLIFGAQHDYLSTNQNILRGFAGDDILVSFDGYADLDGGAGNDRLIIGQGNAGQFAGGDGIDTLNFMVNDGFAPFDMRFYADKVSSIEFLAIGSGASTTPAGMMTMTPTHYWTSYDGDTSAVILDRATVAAWGGDLTIAQTVVGKVRLADVAEWTLDGHDNGFARYSATYNGQTVHLSIADWVDQPIQGDIVGGDEFSLFGLSFQSFDGGGGDDVVMGGINKYYPSTFGVMDFSNAATQPFANIEAFSLAGGDALILSAASVNAMTDSRNAIWVGSFRETPLVPAAGTVSLIDPANWTAQGYVTFSGTLSLPAATGVLYQGTDAGSGETVSLVVSATMTQPAVANAAAIDHWYVDFDGIVLLMPADAATDPAFANYLYDTAHNSYYLDQAYGLGTLDYYLTSSGIDNLDIIDLHGAFATKLQLTAEGSAEVAGDDHVLSVIGDAGIDGVSFFDAGHWHLAGVERGAAGEADFYIYTGDDGQGHLVTLRVDTTLTQPGLGVDATDSDDYLRVTDLFGGPIDGKDGIDVLQILAEGTLDLTTGAVPVHVEALDLRNGAANDLVLDAAAVTAMAGNSPLFIVGDANDTVTTNGSWQQAGHLPGQTPADPSFNLYLNAASGATIAIQDNLLIV